MSTNNQPLQALDAPSLDPSIQKAIDQYLAAEAERNKIFAKIKALAAGLNAHDPRVMQEIMMIMYMRQDASTADMKAYSASLNVDTALLNKITGGHDGFNNAAGGTDPTTQAQNLYNAFQNLQNFLNYEQGQIKAGQPSVIDQNTINAIQQAMNNVKGCFNISGGGVSHNDWGDFQKMGQDIQIWNNLSGGGNFCVQMQTIQNAFQTLNQTASSQSAKTQTKLQAVAQDYKTFIGLLQTFISGLLKLTQTHVDAQISH